VKDGEKVQKGQILVEWDPYTFSILTEGPGQVRFKDIIDKVTVHEEVDEITGLSRLIIVESPDEKKQPASRNRRAGRQGAAQVPHAVERALDGRNGEQAQAGDVLAKIPRENDEDQGHHRRSAACRRLFEARQAA
jgi:DNA-directed RNA polymerase subunit beta'